MKLTVLGCGTLVPREDRSSPSLFLEIDNKKILLDCGPGTLRQMTKAGFNYRDLDMVILSHTHTDHVNDLAALLQAFNYTPDFVRQKDLYLIGYPGINNFLTDLYTIYPDIKPISYQIKVISQSKYNFGNLTVETSKGKHDPSSIIIKITESSGKNLIYTSDTGPDENIHRFAQKTNLLITECSHPPEKLKGIHLTPEFAGEMAKGTACETLMLVHFYPTINFATLEKEIRQYYSGKLILAKDFLTVNI